MKNKVTSFDLKELRVNTKCRDYELVKGYYLLDTKNKYAVVDARLYMGRSSNSSVVYCIAWVNTRNEYSSGSGKAGGYGYHKMSSALEDALHNAGIKFEKSFGGVGDDAMVEALEAIAEYLKLEDYMIHVAYA